jgi:hypothetical protein
MAMTMRLKANVVKTMKKKKTACRDGVGVDGVGLEADGSRSQSPEWSRYSLGNVEAVGVGIGIGITRVALPPLAIRSAPSIHTLLQSILSRRCRER